MFRAIFLKKLFSCLSSICKQLITVLNYFVIPWHRLIFLSVLQLIVMDLQTKQMARIPSLRSSEESEPADCPCGIHSIAINPSKTLLATGAENTNDLAVYKLPTFDPVAVGEVKAKFWNIVSPCVKGRPKNYLWNIKHAMHIHCGGNDFVLVWSHRLDFWHQMVRWPIRGNRSVWTSFVLPRNEGFKSVFKISSQDVTPTFPAGKEGFKTVFKISS